MLIGVYTLGFVLPFLAVGMFASSLLSFLKKHSQVVKYTVKLGGILMLIMGVLMFTGKMNDVTGYLSTFPAPGGPEVREDQESAQMPGESENESSQGKGAENGEAAGQETDGTDRAEGQLPASIDFTLTDQYGNTHTLSDYKGKTVFLNFGATWCPPCRAEMPDIQKLYDSFKEERDDSLVILGVAGPDQGRETSVEGIKDFLEENGYTYPVLMDMTGEQFMNYGVSALPTTYMIDKDGNVFGYVSGQISEEIMRDIIRQTMEGKRR